MLARIYSDLKDLSGRLGNTELDLLADDLRKHLIGSSKDCLACERWDGAQCKVFKEKPEKCWAWTDDPDWEAKVDEAVRKYRWSKGCC